MSFFVYKFSFFAIVLATTGILYIILKAIGKRVYGLAKFVNAVARFFGGSLIRSFSIEDITIFPLRVIGIKVHTKRTRSQPEVELYIGCIKIDLNIVKTFTELIRGGDPSLQRDHLKVWFLYVEICEFSIKSKTIRFRDFLDPPPGSIKVNKKAKSQPKRLGFVQHLSRMVTIVFNDFSFDFSMPTVACRVRGGSKNMVIFTKSSDNTPPDLSMRVQLTGYYLEIYDNDVSAVRMTRYGMEMLLKQDTNHSRKVQDENFEHVQVDITMTMTIEQATDSIRAEAVLHGRNKVFLDVKPFLLFFEKYQTAEDDSIEMKLIKDMDTLGKMNFIGGTVEEALIVELSDKKRCDENITIRVSEIYGYIQKEKMPGEQNMERKLKKSLFGRARLVEWLGHPGNFVEDVRGSIVKNVINEVPFIDNEETNGDIAKVIFSDVQDHLLKWLFIMQEMSDTLPSPRFSHLKKADLNVFISEFVFRTFPDTCRSASETHRKNVLFSLRRWSIRIESVVWNPVKRYTVRSDEFHIQSDMNIDVLQETLRTEISVKEPVVISGSKAGVRDESVIYTGTNWSIPGMNVVFGLGTSNMQLEKFVCNGLAIDCFNESLNGSIQNSYGYAQSTIHQSYPFLRTSYLTAIWTGKDVNVTFSEAKVLAGMSAVLKVLRTQDAIKRMVDRCLYEMAVSKGTLPASPSPQDEAITSVTFHRLFVDVPVSRFYESDDIFRSNPMYHQIKMIFENFTVKLKGSNSSTYAWSRADFFPDDDERPFFSSLKFEFVSIKAGLNAQPPSPSEMNLSVEKFTLSLIGNNELDLYITGLLGQYDGWKIAMLPWIDEHPLKAIPSSDPFFATIKFNTFELKIDSYYGKSVIPNFLTIQVLDLDVNIDSTATENEAFGKIHAADDFLNANKLSYFGVAGGDLKLLVTKFSIIMLSDVEDPVIQGCNLKLKGNMYSASVKDERLLQCLRAELIENCDSLFAISATVVKNSAPSKLYGNLELSADSFDVLVKEETAELLSSVTTTISQNFPPRAVDPHTPPLQLWDNLNYWLHGQFCFLANRISTSICMHLEQTELFTVKLNAEKMEYKSSKNCMDFKGSNFSIDAVVQSAATHQELQTEIESRLFFMPTLQMNHRFKFVGDELKNDFFYGHHDIYLRPEPEFTDKFSKFRSRKHSVHYELKVICSEERSEIPVEVKVCLDILGHSLKLLKRFGQKSETKDDVSISTIDQAQEQNATVSAVSLLDVIKEFNAEFTLHTFIASSWVSKINPIGFVISQKIFLLNVTLRRDIDLLYRPFLVDQCQVTVNEVDLYTRDWDTKGIEATETSEPKDFKEIRSMFEDMYKIAHAQKVEVNLSADGTASVGPQGPMVFHLEDDNDSDNYGPIEFLPPIPPQNQARENKIWGLRIELIRLLWTIYIRDVVFAYVASTFVLYEKSKDKSNSSSFFNIEEYSKAKSTLSRLLAEEDETSELSADDSTINSSEKRQGLPSRTIGVAIEPLVINVIRGVDFTKIDSRLRAKSNLDFPTVIGARRKISIAIDKSPSAANRGTKSTSTGNIEFEEEKIASTVSSEPSSQTIASSQYKSASESTSKFIRYFFVELINPQVNFFDLSSHNCFILRAGKSSLEGLKSRSAFLVSGDEIRLKNKLELRWEGVSLYTAHNVKDSGTSSSDHDKTEVLFFNETNLSSGKIKVAVNEFKIDADYEFVTTLNRDEVEMNSMKMETCRPGDLLYSFKLVLPSFHIVLQSGQFTILLNVTRRLLLAAPPPFATELLEKQRQTNEEKSDKLIKSFNRSEFIPKPSAVLNMNNYQSRDELREVIESIFKSNKLETTHEIGIARSNEIRIGQGTWTLRKNDTDEDLMNISFTGLYACHILHDTRCTSSLLEVQMFRVDQSSPSDPKQKQNTTEDPTLVMRPKVNDNPICSRCHEQFSIQENNHKSCRAHCDSLTGKRGIFGYKSSVKSSSPHFENEKSWSCCGSSDERSKGCSYFPHLCKEVMFQVSAEAMPLFRIEDVEVSVLNALNISIFPETKNEIKVQVCKNLSDGLHEYFSIDDKDVEKDLKREDEKLKKKKKKTIASFFGFKSSAKETDESLDKSTDHIEILGTPARPQRRLAPQDLSAVTVTSMTGDRAKKINQEALYIKYMRVGEAVAEVSTSGYSFTPLNIHNYRVCVDPFVLHGKVLDWARLLYKLEYHTAQSVFSHTATNWGTSLVQSIRGSTAAYGDTQIQQELPEIEKRKFLLGAKKTFQEDDDAKRKSFLGGGGRKT